MRRRSFLLATSGLVLFGSRAHAESDVDAVLAEVARARAGVKTLVGPFTQERTIGMMATKIRSTGTLTLIRPDRLRWELDAPDAVVYWVGPEGFAYQGARGQGKVPAGKAGAPGQNGKLAAAMDDIRVLLGGDLARLKERYELRLTAKSPEGVTFEADPREPGPGRLSKIVFSLDGERIRPTRATLVEGPRDRTEIVFGALKRDAVVDPARVRPPF
jgi:outer membrane lipoprotein-sorting protein